MEFRLLYSGDGLTCNGSGADKHAIRRVFNPQLKQLWNSNSQLQRMSKIRGMYSLDPSVDANGPDGAALARAAFFNQMATSHAKGAYRYIPLVEPSSCLRVSLDILFLRRDSYALVTKSGDIDNRIKTLFDALKIPDVNDGCGVPDADEDPFFVLIQDDALISEISVNTDNLLMLPSGAKFNSRDVFLVINVKLKTTERTAHNWAFE